LNTSIRAAAVMSRRRNMPVRTGLQTGPIRFSMYGPDGFGELSSQS
jgi:hypothetical protein